MAEHESHCRRNVRRMVFGCSSAAVKPKTVDEAVQVLKTQWLGPRIVTGFFGIPKKTSGPVCIWGAAPVGETGSDCGEALSLSAIP
jgi:hypothetical protein